MILAGLIAGLLAADPPSTELPWRPATPPITELVEGRLRVRPRQGTLEVLLKIPEPTLPAPRFVLKSRASGRVDGNAWLEMYVHLTDGGVVSIRTRDTGGPMAWLRGEFRDRAIELPFAGGPENRPTFIGLAMGTDADAVVDFEPFVIEEWRSFTLTWFASGGFAMLIGVGLGLLGGLYALLAAIPTFRRTAYVAGRLLTWLGVLAMIAAVGLYYSSSPSGIWISLGVAGALSLLGFGLTLPLVRKGLADVDQRRAAADGSLEPA